MTFVDKERRRLLAHLRSIGLIAGSGGLLAGADAAAAAPPAAAAPASGAALQDEVPRAAGAGPAAGAGEWSHAWASYGEPKYPRDFANFGYVNPDAPKRGTLYLANPDRRSSFDKFNNFTLKGNAPAGLALLMLEPLAVLSGDEPQTMYGLLAQQIRVAPDRSSVEFRLHPQARFYNGDPVTASDVLYSFQMLSGPQAAPSYQQVLAGVERAVVVDARTIRFELRERSMDLVLYLGTGLRVFSPKWAIGPDGKQRRFDEIVDTYPITSGPYKIGAVQRPRRIEFERNPEYWARDLPVRRGFFNFDRIVYRYYQDNDVKREAFKAGEFDLIKEYSAKSWVRLHRGPKWDDGRIVKDPFPTKFAQGLQSYEFNLRRPKYQDIRVREAIGLAYDFEMTLNRYGQYTRADSMFNNSDFAAQGLPSEAELKLLEPFRKELPETVFGPAFVAPRTNGEPARLRKNLLRARALLDAAGWKLGEDGWSRNAQGEVLAVEYMIPGEGGNRLPEWTQNLEKLGVRFEIREVDFALYNRRLEEYDFDLVAIVEGKFTLPPISDLVSLYGSKSADEKGNGNYRGVKSRAVDALLDALQKAKTLDELRVAARALDRVVMWNYWQVPDLWFSNERVSYWNKFGMPATRPLYYTIESSLDDQPAWGVTCWWIKDGPVKAA